MTTLKHVREEAEGWVTLPRDSDDSHSHFAVALNVKGVGGKLGLYSGVLRPLSR